MEQYRFLRESADIKLLRFGADDEVRAVTLLTQYSDHRLSFHDALCAAVMLRVGIPSIFTFDSDFYALGFIVLPGTAG